MVVMGIIALLLALPNLIRTSRRSDPINAPAVASRASSVNSATDPAIGGRVVSASRWNKHYLLPMANPSSADSDPAPVAQFTPPDCLFLTSAGVTQSPAPSAVGNSDEARETIARALGEVTTTRTWGLLIDVIAQSGRGRPGATNLVDFVVQGEKRYWLHIAIDRFSGEVIDQQLEAVYE